MHMDMACLKGHYGFGVAAWTNSQTNSQALVQQDEDETADESINISRVYNLISSTVYTETNSPRIQVCGQWKLWMLLLYSTCDTIVHYQELIDKIIEIDIFFIYCFSFIFIICFINEEC